MSIIIGPWREETLQIKENAPMFPPGYIGANLLRINHRPSQHLMALAGNPTSPYRASIHTAIHGGLARYVIIGPNFQLPNVGVFNTEIPVGFIRDDPVYMVVWFSETRNTDDQLIEYYENVPVVPPLEPDGSNQGDVDEVVKKRSAATQVATLYIPKGVFPVLREEELNDIGRALHNVCS